jgi:AcrR family transcriptional regulator
MCPKTKDQFEQIREESREKILNAALKLFGTKGYDHSTIADVMKLAGVSKGLLYHYFANKEDLVKQLVFDLINKTDALLFDHAIIDPNQLLKNIFTQFFQELRNNFEQWTLLANLGMQLGKFDWIRQLANDQMQQALAYIEEILIKIDWPDPCAEAKILVALFDGISFQYLWFKKDYHLDELENILINKYCKQ